MDPLVGIVGAVVIASWAFGLIRDTGAILLDMTPDREHGEKLPPGGRRRGRCGSSDLHLWRLGPGHLGAIISLRTEKPQPAFYRAKLARFRSLSHVTIEVEHLTAKFQ